MFSWKDTNINGVLDDGEIGETFGTKTLKQWQTSSYNLGVFNTQTTKFLVLKFSVGDITDQLQKANVIYNFVFNGETE